MEQILRVDSLENRDRAIDNTNKNIDEVIGVVHDIALKYRLLYIQYNLEWWIVIDHWDCKNNIWCAIKSW